MSTPRCLCNGPLEYFLIQLSILLFGICSFSISMRNCFLLFLSMLSVTFIFFAFADSNLSLFILNMLWLNVFWISYDCFVCLVYLLYCCLCLRYTRSWTYTVQVILTNVLVYSLIVLLWWTVTSFYDLWKLSTAVILWHRLSKSPVKLQWLKVLYCRLIILFGWQKFSQKICYKMPLLVIFLTKTYFYS